MVHLVPDVLKAVNLSTFDKQIYKSFATSNRSSQPEVFFVYKHLFLKCVIMSMFLWNKFAKGEMICQRSKE